MTRHQLWLAALVGLSLATTFPFTQAQDAPGSIGEPGRLSVTTAVSDKNEFGIWAGYSPFSFKLKGVSEDRRLFLLNLQYARKLLITKPLTLKYTAELVPVALEMQPAQVYLVNSKLLTNPSGTIYGAGANPVGFQLNLGQKRVQPFANGSVGFLYFRQQVPIIGSSQLNYTITVGFGAQFFQKSGRSITLGWKYHHLSNDYQARLNPGIDSSLFYAGFSFPRLGLR